MMRGKKRIVVLSGAGISAESGIKTFRGADGLWEGHAVEDVATPEAWERDFELVLEFYNERRRAVRKARPNNGHLALAKLEELFPVDIITQNIDDLHERAGSSSVLHLHGEILKSRSSHDDSLIYKIDGDKILPGEKCELGSQLRPHVVWFGEPVPAMEEAIQLTQKADIFIVVGTSLLVYPAAGLVDYVRDNASLYLVDPEKPVLSTSLMLAEREGRLRVLEQPASRGLVALADELLELA